MLPIRPKATLGMVNKGLTPVREQTLNVTVRQRRRSRLIATWAAVTVPVVLLALLGYAVIERRVVARTVLTEFLAGAGVGAVRFDVEDVDLNRVVATDLRIGDDGVLTADRVTVAFRPAGLRGRRVDAIVIDGLTASVRVTEDGFVLPPFVPVPGMPVGASESRDWRVDAVTFRAARLFITGPVAADLVADGTLSAGIDDGVSGRFDLRGTITPPGMAPFPVAGPLAFTASAARLASIDLTLASERLVIPDGGVAEATVSVAYAAGTSRIDVRAADGDDHLTITATGSGPADDPATVDTLHATFDAGIAGLPLPGTGTVVGVEGRGWMALTADGFAVGAETPLGVRVGDGPDAASLRIAPSPEPILTIDTPPGRPRVARLRFAKGDITLADGGAEVGDVAVDAVFDQAMRVVVDRLRLTPSGLAGWTAPLHVSPTRVPADDRVSARRITVMTDGQNLGDRMIEDVVIDGLDLPLRITAGDGISGPVAPLLIPGRAGGGDDTGSAWQIATLRLTDARLRITGDVPADLAVDGSVTRDAAGLSTGTFRVRGNLAPPRAEPIAVEGPAAVTVANGTLHAAHLSLATPAGAARTLSFDADWDAAGLSTRVRFVGDDDRVAIDARLPAVTTAPGGLVGAQATFDLAVTDVPLPGRPMHVSLAGRGSAAIDGAGLAVSASTPLTAAMTKADGPSIRLTVAAAPTPFLVLGPDPLAPAEARLAIADADAGVGATRATIRGAEVLVGIGAAPRIDVRRAVVTPVGNAAWPHPVNLTGNADVGDDAIAFRGRLSSHGNRVQAAVTGQHRLDAGRGSARVRVDPLDFTPGRLEPQHLVPHLADALKEVFGRVIANGTVSWRRDRPLATDINVGVEDLSLTAFGTRLSDIDAALRFTGIDPPTAPAGQEVRIARIALPTPISDAVVRFGLDRSGRLNIDEARFGYLGGSVVTSDASIDTARARLTATFDLEGIDMQALLAAAGIEQITAQGRVAGRIPLVASETELAIRGAELRAMSPGVIVYDPPGAPSLSAAGPGGDLVAKALRNFRYDSLELAIDGESGGTWSAGGVITGHNPDVFRGQPFQFNIDVSGDVEETVRGVLFGHTLRDRIEERILRERR